MISGSDLQIELRERPGPAGLRIDYTFTNQGAQPVYVYTLITGADHEPLPRRAYVALRDRPRALHLSLGRPPGPGDGRLCGCSLPLASRLRPRGSLVGSVELPTPAREWSPYFGLDDVPDGPAVMVEQVLLTTEYFRERDSISVQKVDRRP